MRATDETISPATIPARSSDERNGSLFLRNVAELNKEPHRRICLHRGLLLLVPSPEIGNAGHRILKYERHTAAGRQKSIQLELEFKPAGTRQADEEILGL